MPTDTERLDWLSTQDGYALVSDDGGRWAVVTDGMQNVPDDEPADIQTMLIRLTHADASARTMGIPEQSRSAPLEG
jgi:hypothetical protein